MGKLTEKPKPGIPEKPNPKNDDLIPKKGKKPPIWKRLLGKKK